MFEERFKARNTFNSMVCCLLVVRYIFSFCIVLDSMILAVSCIKVSIPVPNFAERSNACLSVFIRAFICCLLNKSSLLYIVMVGAAVGRLSVLVFLVGSSI